MKIFTGLVFTILSFNAKAQTYISGTAPAAPGSTQYYEAHFQNPLNQLTTVSWTVSGGTIISKNENPATTVSCNVVWDNDPQTAGTISVYEDLGSQYAELTAQSAGYSAPTIVFTEWITYGVLTTPLTIYFNLAPEFVSYQWQIWDPVSLQWNNLSGEIVSSYQPPVLFMDEKYRCIVVADGITYYLEAPLKIASLSAGILYYPLNLIYNTQPVINTSNGSGGFCIPTQFIYTWEYSIEGGPWVVFGIGSSLPSNAPLLTSKIQFRRKIQCGNQEMYSNILTLIPDYTPTDFENLTYVRTISVVKRGVQSYFEADALPIGDKFQSTTYLDGLGRSVQTVDKGISSSANDAWKDIVKQYAYDATGRTIRDYLPYASNFNPGKFKSDASITSEQGVYLQNFYNEPGNAPTYTEFEYDESPLNKVVKTKAPGSGWMNTGVTLKEEYNIDNEEVHIWNLDYSSTALPVTTVSAVYSTGKLIKNTGEDEKGNKVITYTDLNGNVVLKKIQESEIPDVKHGGWNCTYYVYDDFGKLRFTIPDKAVKYLEQNLWNLSATIADEFCFKYVYDKRGRMVIKKQPGIAESGMVYDERDRQVFSQEPNQRGSQWYVTLYDELNRPDITGLINYTGDLTTLQTSVNARMAQYPTNSPRLPINLVLFESNTTGLKPAVGSITMVPGFESGADFTAEISTNSDGPDGETYVLEGVTVNKNPIPNGVSLLTLSVTYRGDYEFGGSKSFNSNYSLAYTTSTPNIEPTEKTIRTTGFITGEKIRILDEDGIDANDKFLYSTAYFDEQSRMIQVSADNIKNGVDYEVSQFDFSGKLVSSFTSHTPGASMTYTITSRHEYDKVGRLKNLYKNFNNSFYKQLAEYSYDELSHLKTKRLAPGYNGNQIELLTYDYNIQNSLTGINKEYALHDDDYSQWDHFFGLYLGYENRDNKFNASQYNGNLTGVIWRSQGDNTPRKFDFEYDRLGRFKTANYRQRNKPSESTWNNTQIDFSTYVQYEDGNGNLKSMKHMGVLPGVNNAVRVDDLQYTYMSTGVNTPTSNKLLKVDETGDLSVNNNGLLSDFKDATGSQDYTYDLNGNLVKDLNKNIRNGSSDGIIYNFMNKPVKIVIDGKSTIEFTYDASGEKLKKKVSYTDGSWRMTTYMGDFVYEQFKPAGSSGDGEQLSYVLHEEGRVKIITPHSKSFNSDYTVNAGAYGINNWPGGKQGVFEYFVKDQLGSTRMVLTEEIQKEFYYASMNDSEKAQEEPLFGQVDANGQPTNSNELRATRFPNGQHTWPNNNSDVSRLTATASDKIMGPNMILKVMSGDIIESNVKYYFANNNSSGPTNTLLNNVVGSFVSALNGGKATAIAKAQSVGINNNLLSGNPDLGEFLDGHNNPGSSAPKAYLNIIFLDEQFRFIKQDPVTPFVGSSFDRVLSGDAGSSTASMGLSQKAPKNGWAFIFLTNESNEVVYFDDLFVTQDHSRISEENHYYPFGQKIAGISSHAVNKMDNKYDFQGDFAEHEDETGYDEFFLRMYEPQIGRWTGADPYDEYASPYLGMGNNPINCIDPDGGGITPGGMGSIFGATLGFATPYIIDALNGKEHHIEDKFLWGIGGAFLGAGLGHALGATAFNNDGSSFGGNFRAYYKGLFNSQEGWVTSFDRNRMVTANSEIPKIWGGNIALPNLTNPFEWIPDSRNRDVFITIAERILGQMITDPNVIDRYPSYGGNIQLPANNGNLLVRIDGGTPGNYKFTHNINPGTNSPGATSVNFKLDPDVLQIRGLREDTYKHYDQARRSLDDVRRATIQNTVQVNNGLKVQVVEKRVQVVKFKYLKAFGIKLKFIRKK